MLSEGQTVFAVAKQQSVMPETIRERRRRWLKNGLASLPDQPRSGAPSKLNEDHRALLKEWIDAEPLTCRTLVSRLIAERGVTISAGTMRNELKRMGYVWTRTRYSIKKRDPERFAQARHEIAELIEQAQTGVIELAYVDEAGSAPQHRRTFSVDKKG